MSVGITVKISPCRAILSRDLAISIHLWSVGNVMTRTRPHFIICFIHYLRVRFSRKPFCVLFRFLFFGVKRQMERLTESLLVCSTLNSGFGRVGNRLNNPTTPGFLVMRHVISMLGTGDDAAADDAPL